MKSDRILCLNPDYRHSVTQMANLSYCLGLIKPNVNISDQHCVENFALLASTTQQQINECFKELHELYHLSYEEIAEDVQECIKFLPQKEIKEYLEAARKNQLH